MARDYEGMYDLPSMDDEEIRELIADQLSDYGDIDTDGIEVQVAGGHVRLTGRVGTEQELHAIESVLTDVIGLRQLDNELVVDAIRRGEQAEAADEANAERVAREGTNRGGANRTEDSAEHLLTDTASEQFGTGDMREAIERGYSYNPPASPIQEGNRSAENH